MLQRARHFRAAQGAGFKPVHSPAVPGSAGKVTVQVPGPYKAAVADLAGLPADQQAALLRALRDFSPSTDLEKLAQSIHRAVPALGVTQAQRVVAVLLNAYLEIDKPAPVTEIATQLLENLPEGTVLTERQQKDFVRLVQEAFANEGGFGLSAKALSVRTEYQRNFVECRILTDIRPVFKPGGTSVIGFTISHDLRLTTNERERLTDVHVSCDEEDLIALKSRIERALEKAREARKLIPNVPYVGA
jgi:hypothetical protein